MVDGRFIYFLSLDKSRVKVVHIYDTVLKLEYERELIFEAEEGYELEFVPKTHIHIEQEQVGGPMTIWA